MTRLYCKPTVGNSVLHASSFHPEPLLTSIPYSQYLRTRRNCSDEISFKREAKILQNRLLERGCTKPYLKKAYKRAIENTTNDLLYGIREDKSTDSTTRIIINYSNQHQEIQNVIQKYWYLLSMDPNIGRFISKMPCITFRRATSIKDHIIHSKYKGEGRRGPWKLKGTYTCGG